MAPRKGAAGNRTEEDFTISWVFNAPRERLFKAWTDPEELKLWWGPRHFTTPVARLDLRPGGRYFNCMRGPDGKDYCSTGTLREVKAPERLIYTDSFADGKGNRVPPSYYGMDPAWPSEIVVDVTFEEQPGMAGMSRVTVRLGVPRSIAERQMAAQGWAEMLVKLSEYLEKAGAGPGASP